MRNGQVRCGHCQTAFDGVEQLVALAPRAEADDDIGAHDEVVLGPPTEALLPPSFTVATPAATMLADGAVEGRVEGTVDDTSAGTVEGTVEGTSAGRSAPDAGVPTPQIAPVAAAEPAAQRPQGRRRLAPMAYAVAVPLLILLLFGQAAFHFRDAIAVRWPALSPFLERMCAELGCTVGAPREISELTILSSDLRADPAHQGLLILTATLRNRGSLPLAYPYLELTLTDAQDQVVVRRALAPGEYAGGTADLAKGIPAHGEVAIKLFIDASATAQAGYRLYLFYG